MAHHRPATLLLTAALALALASACARPTPTPPPSADPAVELLREHGLDPHLDDAGRLEGFWDSNRDQMPLPPAVWAALGDSPTLRWLGMARAGAEDLGAIGGLAQVQSLNLGGGTRLGDDRLAALRELTALEELNIHHLRGWRGEDLIHLVELPALRDLTIHNCWPFDRGLEAIARMAALEVVHFTAVPITAADCAPLAALPHLRDLTVAAEPGPASWQALAALPQLESLHILYRQPTRLDAESFRILLGMSLRELRAINLQLTRSQHAALRERHPDLVVILRAKDDPHAEAIAMPLIEE